MKKGFTLIELLAVIVILAIVALIATPLIMDVIEQSKQGAFKSTAYGIVESGELNYANDVLNGTVGEVIFTYTDGVETSEPGGKNLNYKGTKPQNGTVIVNKNGKIALAIHDGNNCAQKGYDESEVYMSDKTVDKCIITGDGSVIGGDNGSDGNQLTDTSPPELIIPNDITIYNTEISSFDVMEGVSATDDSGGIVNITTSGDISESPGPYTITYKATDVSNNETVKERVITVFVETADSSKASAPELTTGMIPVKWDGTNWVKADIDNGSGANQWYDYDNKMWANAVTVTNTNRATYESAAIGTTIPMNDINTMWVWVPRYKYAIPTGTGPREINVIFESKYATKSIGTAVDDDYLTHPAFTFGTDEVSGIWVGKFETTGTIDSPTILPNSTSLRNQTIKAMYDSARNNIQSNTSTYGFSNDGDVHIMKNNEWGAMAYLSHSKYGINNEIWVNNNSQYITGCAGNSVSEVRYDGCQNEYHTTTGVNASTTGTIYGIYDVSGGAYEFVMANYNNVSENSGFSDVSTIPSKYIEIFTSYDEDTACNGEICNGGALSETSGWYSDTAIFMFDTYTWLRRGGHYYNHEYVGAFLYFSDPGSGGNSTTCRLTQIKL